jgi:predicted amidohydrolase YtcJ
LIVAVYRMTHDGWTAERAQEEANHYRIKWSNAVSTGAKFSAMPDAPGRQAAPAAPHKRRSSRRGKVYAAIADPLRPPNSSKC